MSFDFKVTQSFSTVDDVYSCLNAWSQNMTSISCKKDEKTSILTLTILKNNSSSTVKVKEATVKHVYKQIRETTSFGVPELSEHYKLELKGKNEEGKDFTFTASRSFDSEDDGKSWSGPYENSSLV